MSKEKESLDEIEKDLDNLFSEIEEKPKLAKTTKKKTLEKKRER